MRRERKKKKNLRALLLIPFLLLFFYAGGRVVGILYESHVRQQKFSELSDRFYGAQARMQTAQQPSSGTAAAPQTDGGTGEMKPFQALSEENPDIGGWVRIEGTTLNYPVMFTPKNPEKYLRKAFDGSYSVGGVPFVGAGCSILPPSENIILFGHHMDDGTMFACLVDYGKKSFFDKHPVIEFSTLYESHRYEIFAAFATDLTGADALRCYRFIQSADRADFDEFVAGVKKATPYDTGIKPEYGDRLLTLSTCSYHTQDGRFVVIARQMAEEG